MSLQLTVIIHDDVCREARVRLELFDNLLYLVHLLRLTTPVEREKAGRRKPRSSDKMLLTNTSIGSNHLPRCVGGGEQGYDLQRVVRPSKIDRNRARRPDLIEAYAKSIPHAMIVGATLKTYLHAASLRDRCRL